MARRATLQEIRALQAEIEQLAREKRHCDAQLARLIDQFQHVKEQSELTFEQVERLLNAIKAFNLKDNRC